MSGTYNLQGIDFFKDGQYAAVQLDRDLKNKFNWKWMDNVVDQIGSQKFQQTVRESFL